MSIAFLDTEFNAHGGALISIGLACLGSEPTDVNSCYGVVQVPKKPHPWVAEHVIPLLGRTPEGREVVRQRVFKWLREEQISLIIADWPADLTHFLELLYKEHDPSMIFPMEIKLELINSGKFTSEIPHNAESDAIALMKWYYGPFIK